MNVLEFKENVKNVYNKYFEGSHVDVSMNQNSIYKSIYITFSLANNINECINNIAMNDMFSITFQLEHNDDEFNRDEFQKLGYMILPENLTLEKKRAFYRIKPQEKYLAYSSKNITFRKTKGNAQKIITSLERFLKKLHDQLLEDLKNNLVHDNFIDLVNLRLKKINGGLKIMKDVYQVTEHHKNSGFGYELYVSDENDTKVTINLNDLKDLEEVAESKGNPKILSVNTYYTYVNDDTTILGYMEV